MKKRPKFKYELIDNETGKILISAPSSSEALGKIAQYLLNNAIPHEDVSYIIAANGHKMRIAFRVTGSELHQLLEDEQAGILPAEGTDEW